MAKDKAPWDLGKNEKKTIEKSLKQCSCGGYFMFEVVPKCPICKNSLESLLPDKVYYLDIGKSIDSEKEDIWEDDN